jgi:hypothetical protein
LRRKNPLLQISKTCFIWSSAYENVSKAHRNHSVTSHDRITPTL